MENYRNFNFEKPTQIQKSTQTSQPNKINGNNNKVNKNKNETKNNNVVGAQKDNTNTNNNKGGSREIGSQNNEPLGDRINQMSKVNQNSPTAVVNNAVAATAIGNYDNNYATSSGDMGETDITESMGSTVNNTITTTNTGDDNTLHTIVIIIGIVIIAIFSLTLVRLKNRSNDKKPISEKSLYDRNKPLPSISPSQLLKHSKLNQQMSNVQVQSAADMSYNDQLNYTNQNMIANGNPNVVEYDLQQQQQQYGYDDNRISFLALGDSAIEPRQATLSLKEEVIKKSTDNLPIPLIHINNKKAPESDSNEYGKKDNDDDDDDINLKAVEPLPGTIIPSKKSPQNSFSNNRLLQESHGLFKKVTKGVKNVGSRLKQNSIMSTMSNSSKSSNDINNSNVGRYSVLSSPKN